MNDLFEIYWSTAVGLKTITLWPEEMKDERLKTIAAAVWRDSLRLQTLECTTLIERARLTNNEVPR